MATLVSPGVSVTVIDESYYTSAGQGTVPFIMIATEQNKINAAGTEIAVGTKVENAGKLYQITSQRELLSTFGNPVFKNVNGTPINGDALNEYGLLAAYSYLGASNRAYVMRADVDLGQLEASTLPPTSKPVDGTYWLKTDTLDPAIYEWDAGASKWIKQEVYVGNSYTLLTGNVNGGVYGDGRDVIISNVPSNYKYAMLSSKYPLIESFELHGQDVSKIDASVYVGLYNFVAKIVNGQFYWLSSALGVNDLIDTTDPQLIQYNDVYPTKRKDLSPLQSGDIWVNTSKNVYDLKKYSATSDAYTTIKYPINISKNEGLNYYGGLNSIKVGDVIAVPGEDENYATFMSASLTAVNFFEWRGGGYKLSPYTVQPTQDINTTFDITFQLYETGTVVPPIIKHLTGTVNNILATINSDVVLADYGVTVSYNTELKKFKFESLYGKTYTFSFNNNVDCFYLGFDQDAVPYWGFTVDGWKLIDLVPSVLPPASSGVDLTYWYDESFKVDIMVNDNGLWVNPTFAVYLTPSEPTATAGDLWIDTTKVKEYPYIQRYTGSIWELVDNTDQTTPKGIVFADARVDETAPAGRPSDNVLIIGELDGDAPNPLRYPEGMLLFNTRYSSRNVKQYRLAYRVGDSDTGALIGDRWVSISGLKQDGSPYMGVDAVRRVIAKKMQASLITSESLRSEDIFYNLIASPGFPEVIDEMLTLNGDRGETAFVLGDCPFDLANNSTDIVNWASNAFGADSDGQDGLVSANENLGVYYPCGITTNVDGAEVVVPPSHMTLRTFAYNDSVAYPWFAPAGLQRGIVTNATNVGYVSSEGEFTPVSLNQGLRDVMYLNNINPIRQMTNRGPVVWGQKTRSPVSSALDRVNVARLVNYIRYQAPRIVEPYLFEQNDPTTRKAVKAVMDSFFTEIANLRGIYDWLVVCDDSNNTPARIDRNELWVDVLVKPEKTIEFIYIPIRLRKTGDDLAL